MDGPVRAAPDGAGSLLRLKVVPGASKSAIVGLHGDRLKVRVGAPPEGGKANRAVLRLLAEHLGVPKRAVRVVGGETSPQKTVAVEALPPTEVVARLGLDRAAP